jgi:hypothetical protein
VHVPLKKIKLTTTILATIFLVSKAYSENSNPQILTQYNHYHPNRIKLSLFDMLSKNEQHDWDTSTLRYRIDYMQFLILLDEGKFHGVSSSIFLGAICFVFPFSGGNAWLSNPILLMLNGGLEINLAKSLFIEMGSVFHPMLFVKNSGIIYENKLGLIYDAGLVYGLSFYSFFDILKKYDHKMGLNFSIGLHSRD